MTARGIRIAAVFVLGTGAAFAVGQTLTAQASQKVAAQIVQPDQEDEFLKGTVPVKTPGLTLPVVRRQSHPKYTPAAMREKVQGDVTLQAVIGVDGRVEKARVKEALHQDLDVEALNALDGWEFEPGRINGEPVRVVVEVQMAFRLHK